MADLLDHWREVERELLRDHAAAFVAYPAGYFRDWDTRPGPTPQGRPGDSRRD